MKAQKSHYLYDSHGHIRRGNVKTGTRKPGARKSNGKAQGSTWSKDEEVHNVRIYQYILSTAVHFTRHSSLIRHEPGRPHSGQETHTHAGFIRGCVAATAYVACLLRPGVPLAEREELTGPAPEDHPAVSYFRESACALFGPHAVQQLESIADGQVIRQGATIMPEFLSDELTIFIQHHFNRAEDPPQARPVRQYAFTAPKAIIDHLKKSYRVRHGSLSEFLTRAVMHFAYQTRLREKQLLANPQASAKILLNEAAQKDIDYRDLL